jgi:ElaB/YqjD/DUF883 family membrane-anchored ribosome-binding protein
MNKHKQTIEDNMNTLAEDARGLRTATADVAGDKVSEARNRLAAALDQGKEVFGRVREKAVEGAKAADQHVRENPYQTLVITFGVGAVIGFLLARCNRD